jgi:hypothetical protein
LGETTSGLALLVASALSVQPVGQETRRTADRANAAFRGSATAPVKLEEVLRTFLR